MENSKIETTNGNIKSIIAFLKEHKLFFIATLITNAIIIKIGLGVDRLANFNPLIMCACLFMICTFIEFFYKEKGDFFAKTLLGLYCINILMFLSHGFLSNQIVIINNDSTYFAAKQILYFFGVFFSLFMLCKICVKYSKLRFLSILICFLLISLTTIQFFSFRSAESYELWFNKENGIIMDNGIIFYIPFLMSSKSLYTIVPKIPAKDLEVKVNIVYKEGKDSKWRGGISFDGYILVDITPRNYSAYQKIKEFHLKPIRIEAESRDGVVYLVEEEILKQTNFEKGDISISISGIW